MAVGGWWLAVVGCMNDVIGGWWLAVVGFMDDVIGGWRLCRYYMMMM